MANPGLHEPFLTVVSAPSGAGKTTVCRQAVAQLDRIRFSVSHTTRQQRRGERDEVDYHFVAPPTFHELVEQDAFLEWADVYGNLYGTSREEVAQARGDGIDLLVEIDVQGARQILAKEPSTVSVFILPPSLPALAKRLGRRGTDSDEEIRRRLDIGKHELAAAGDYDYWIINDNLSQAVDTLAAIITAERAKRSRLRLDDHPLAPALAPC